jgi:prolyl-tRNA synthetase
MLMRQSFLFTKTRRDAPADEVSKNAQLLIRGGYVHKAMAGVYEYLPLGKMVLERIMGIIREEMNAIGGQEVLLATLQAPPVWEASGRWSDEAIDVWFKTALNAGGTLGLAPTHEEPLTALMQNFISSYKDLPVYPYQFQNKFRNELRAKSGIMRTREFIMKDLYSFSRDEAQFREFYESCAQAYLRIFNRVGLGEVTYRTFASGGSFSKFSDEFQTVSDAGEDIIYIHDGKHIAVNKEVYQEDVLAELGIQMSELREAKSIEVGNIFPLGTRFAEALGLTYTNEQGASVAPIMGSYGIGPGRLMGTIVEIHSDERGIHWPRAVAPFAVHIIAATSDEAVLGKAAALYEKLTAQGIRTLYDDRTVRAGEKFADADLLGMPLRVTVGSKLVGEPDAFELYYRSTGQEAVVDTKGIVAAAQ